MRVLAPALRRHIGHRALNDLQQRLLHAFTGDIAGDGGVIGLARDLVDLVNVDDTLLGACNIEVGGLDQAQQDILHILADVAGLGQGRGIGDTERHVQDTGQRLRQQSLAAAGGTDQQNIALMQLHLVDLHTRGHTLVVVVDGNGEHTLGPTLPHHILIQLLEDTLGRGNLGDRQSSASARWPVLPR